jgi:outer membrane protein assembly factor BamB
MRRRTIVIVAVLGVLVLLGGGGALAWWVANRPADDIRNADAPFVSEDEPAPSIAEPAEPSGKKGRRTRRVGLPWPVYGRTPERTRDARDLTGVAPPYRLVWKHDRSEFLEFPPSYADGVLYLGTNSGNVVAYNVFTGRVLWRKRFDGVRNEPAVAGRRIFFTGWDGHVTALHRGTGAVAWRRAFPGGHIESSAVVVDGLVLTGANDGTVRALDARSGRVRWSFRADGAVKASLAVHDGRAYFGDYAGVMYAVRVRDGRLVWRTQSSGLASGFSAGRFYGSPAVAYGRVYAGNTDGKVYSFVAGDGQIAWSTSLGAGWVYSSPAVSDGRVFATGIDGKIVALHARSGSLLWERRMARRTLSSPTVIGRLVYAADLGTPGHKGTLYAWNPGTGKGVWQFPDGKYSSVIVAAGRLVVAGFSTLYVLRPRG